MGRLQAEDFSQTVRQTSAGTYLVHVWVSY